MKNICCIHGLFFKENEANERRRLKQQQEQDDNATELANHIYGDILTENPAVALSAWGPHRVIPDRWKGMSPEQIAQVRKTQEDQMKEAEVRYLRFYTFLQSNLRIIVSVISSSSAF